MKKIIVYLMVAIRPMVPFSFSILLTRIDRRLRFLVPLGKELVYNKYLNDLKVNVNTIYPIERDMLTGTYDPDTSAIIKRFIKQDSIAIDVGANIGSISIPVANLMSKDGVEVVSCEASQVMCERFRNNVTLNIIENILINESAIFSHDNGITFYEQKLTNNNMGLSSSRKNFDIGEFVERKVDSISIDSLYESLNTSKSISVIKIDVQGGEIDVLLGASEVIKNHKPVFIFEHEDEYHDNAMSVKNKIKSIFDRNGYDLYVLDSNLDGVLVPIDLSVYVNTNIVALPN